MELIATTPAIIKVLCLFAGIVALYRIGAPLWAALIAVSALTGLWFGAGVAGSAKHALTAAVAADTVFLCVVVVIILGISNVMNETGVLERLVGALTTLLGRSNRSAAALPALIGLLPMPGGAVFSAPMVDTACAGGGQTPEQKSAINYWFRHIWEYWWPLYPGVILASTLFGISAWKLLALHLPLTAAAAASGWFFILRPAFRAEKAPPPRNGADTRAALKSALREGAAIIVMIACIFAVGPVLHLAGVTGIAAKYWPVIIGVAAGTVLLAFTERPGALNIMKMIFNRGQWPMLLLAAGTMIFKGMLMQVGAFDQIQADLVRYRMPAIAVIVALPFISGLVMGLAIGFVGASFPIVISMIPAEAMGADARFAFLTLAYSCGYMGMMLSPVHLCLILTKDYYKADFLGIYRKLAAPAVSVLAAGAALFLLYRAIL